MRRSTNADSQVRSKMGFAKVYTLYIVVLLLTTVRAYQGFEYGVEAADSLLSASGDDSSVEVVGLTPFVFYGSSRTSVFVSIIIFTVYNRQVQNYACHTTEICG